MFCALYLQVIKNCFFFYLQVLWSDLKCQKMVESEENGVLFPIFILTIIAIPLVPYTFVKLSRAFSKKQRSIHCQCLDCDRSGKYKRSLSQRVSIFSFPINFICMMDSTMFYLLICSFSLFCRSLPSLHVATWQLCYSGL